MKIVARSTNVRVSPQKLRLVADVVRGMKISKAELVLRNLGKKAAEPMLGVLNQAVGNAVNNYKLSKDGLVIKTIEIGEGQKMKRWQFASRGRVHQIIKRTSHIIMTVEGDKNGK